MPTANEQKALWFFAFVVLSGGAVRVCRSDAPPPADAAALDNQIRRVDSARAGRAGSGKSRRASRKPAPARVQLPVDIDRATEAEIEALPGIGPSLAGRIVHNRDSAGAFGALEALCDVRGIGAATIMRLDSLVTFSGPRRLLSGACGEASRKSRNGAAVPRSQHR